MILYQKQGQYQRYIGWYGMCGEDGTVDVTDVEADCQTFNMHKGYYENDSHVEIEGTTQYWQFSGGDDLKFRDYVLNVQSVSQAQLRVELFDMDSWLTMYNIYAPSLGATAARDLVDSIVYAYNASLGYDETTGVVHNFTRMRCGKAYSILVKPASETGYETGDTVRTFDLPEFYYTTVDNSSTTYRLTPECCY